MHIEGTVFRYKDNVNTDEIIPARYLNTSDPVELAKHCMEDIDASFVGSAKPGDIIVADNNFGCGSSREHAPVAIKYAGISLVIAASFARIFFRNAINIGLPILEAPAAVKRIKKGDRLKIDLAMGKIYNITRGEEYQAMPFPSFMRSLIQVGGLMNYVKQNMPHTCRKGAPVC
jgi:3-isopropylmalate/(R)-2-methylmalate dehydratase small subunit